MNDFIEALKEIKKESKDFQITLSRNEVLEITNEIDRLNNIIKEVKKYIESYMPNYDFDKTNLIKLLEILGKGE